jgi:fructose transport system ATP-binding protein
VSSNSTEAVASPWGRWLRLGNGIRAHRRSGRRHRGRKSAPETDARIGFRSLTSALENLSGGQRQGVAVARAAFARKLVIMDEFATALSVREPGQVLDLIGRIRDRGLPVIVSHNVPHVFDVADRVHIPRLGRRVALVTPDQHSMSDVVATMTGNGQTADQAPPAE